MPNPPSPLALLPTGPCNLVGPFDEHAIATAICSGPDRAESVLEAHDPQGNLCYLRPLLYVLGQTAETLPWERARPVLEALQYVGASIDIATSRAVPDSHVMEVLVDPAKVQGWLAMGGNPLGYHDKNPAWWLAMLRGQTGVLDVLHAHPRGATLVRMRRLQMEHNDVMSAWANDREPGRDDRRYTPLAVRLASFAWLWANVPADCGRRVVDIHQPGTRGRLLWIHELLDSATSLWHKGWTDAYPDHPLNVWCQVLRAHMTPEDAPWLLHQVRLWRQEREKGEQRYGFVQDQAPAAHAVHQRVLVEAERLALQAPMGGTEKAVERSTRADLQRVRL